MIDSDVKMRQLLAPNLGAGGFGAWCGSLTAPQGLKVTWRISADPGPEVAACLELQQHPLKEENLFAASGSKVL